MAEQLLEAGVLLGVGMSVVFAFLTLLIGGIHSVAWFARAFPEPAETATNSGPSYNKKTSSTPKTVNPNIVASITAAVHAHRRKNN